MMNTRSNRYFRPIITACAVASGLGVVTVPGMVQAQGYPNKPIRAIVGFPAGGGADIIARMIASGMKDALGQNIIVETRPGGGSNIANEHVAKSPPDGYTILVSPATVTINMSLYPKLGYDTLRDLTGVSLVSSTPMVLVIAPTLPVKNVKELVALALRRPGELNFSSAGSGTVSHLAGEVFKTVTKTKMTHIPYKGNAGALTSLIGGEVQLGFPNIAAVIQHIRSGRLRALAITSARKAETLPGVPTLKELGVNVDLDIWYGVLVQSATPRDIVEKLADAVRKSVQTPEVRQRLLDQGADPMGGTPDEFNKLLKDEVALWADIVRTSGAKAD